MNVGELIALLQRHDPTHRVLIAGYEGGLEDVETGAVVTVKLNVHNHEREWYYGPHELAGNAYFKTDEGPHERAVLLNKSRG